MAGMGQTCNHVAAAMYRVEAAVRNDLKNPASNNTAQLLNINDVASALKKIVPTSILFTAVQKPKIDFICEV